LPPYCSNDNQRYSSARIKTHTSGSLTAIEKRPTGLFIDGRKVVLCRSASEINGREMLTATHLDFLFKYPKFIPNEWIWMWEKEYRNEKELTSLWYG
jgi:hypothetical protein